MKKKFVVAVASGLAAAAMLSSVAAAAPPAKSNYMDQYKTGTGDWAGSTLTNVNGSVTAGDGSSMSSYFGGTTLPNSPNRMAWPKHGYIAQIDVYLDPASMTSGDGFDLSVASSTNTGAYGRDFIFNVGMTASGDLRVAGSNNSGFAVNDSVLAGGVKIETAGWYTFQHVFYDNHGTLAADLNVMNKNGVQVFHTTLNDASDLMANVGGPRYQWFTFVDGTIRFDNQRLFLK